MKIQLATWLNRRVFVVEKLKCGMWVYYRNHVTGWELSPMEFGDVNLLVGVSGVGKTMILEAIRSLQKIALGSLINNHRFTSL